MTLREMLRHHRVPLVATAIGIALSICVFASVIAADTATRRGEFARAGTLRLQILAERLQRAESELNQLRQYLRGSEQSPSVALGQIGAHWLRPDGLVTLRWQGRDGGHATLSLDGGAAAPAFYQGADVARARLVERKRGGDTDRRLVLTLPLEVPGGGSAGTLVGELDVDAWSQTAAADAAVPHATVLYLLDAERQAVLRSSSGTAPPWLASGTGVGRPASRTDFAVSRGIELLGETWGLVLAPSTAYLRDAVGPYPWLLLASGLAMTAMVGCILFLQSRQALIIGDRVAEQTQALRTMAQNARRTEARLRAIFETSVDGLITIDHAGVIEDFNPACERIFGYAADEVTGRNISMLMPEPYRSEHAGYLRRYRRTGEARVIGIGRAVHAQRKDGSVFPMELAVAQMQTGDDGAAMRFSGVIRDITERQRLLERLQASNQELEQFAYVASHDLKAPLRGIGNLVSWIEEDLAALANDDTREHLRMLRTRVQRMEQLLDDLLAYSRVGRDDGGASEVVDCARLIENLASLLDRPSEFRIVTGTTCQHALVQRMPLQQVLHNLLSNAIEHHHRTDGCVSVEVQREGPRYLFRVSDDGPGIADKHHARIFEMFQTLQARDRARGSGMGLALVRKIVTRAGGEIRVESTPGAGATFVFDWPAAEPSCAVMPADAMAATSDNPAHVRAADADQAAWRA